MNSLVYIVSQANHSSRFCEKCTLSKLSLSVVIKNQDILKACIKRALLNLLSGYHFKAQAYNIRTRDRCSH